MAWAVQGDPGKKVVQSLNASVSPAASRWCVSTCIARAIPSLVMEDDSVSWTMVPKLIQQLDTRALDHESVLSLCPGA